MSASAIRLLLSSRIFFFCSRAHSTALSWSSGRSLMEKHLPRFLENGTTAIICSQDTLANAALIQCQQLGYQVPDDVSIIGFDDLPIAAYTSPPLTTINKIVLNWEKVDSLRYPVFLMAFQSVHFYCIHS